MRFRICCYFDGDDNEYNPKGRRRRGTIFRIQTGPPLTEQPRRGESIQMETITDLSSDRNPTQGSSNFRESSIASTSTATVNGFTTPSDLPLANICPTVSASSNFNYVARNGEQTTMTFEQVEPGHHRGTYRGKQFSIVNGKLLSTDGDYSPLDRELIWKNYSQAILAMQQGMSGIEARILSSLKQTLPPMNLCQIAQLTTPPGSKINVNFTGDNGEKSKMTFKQIKPGLFRGTFNTKTFSIANGQILTLDGADHGLNKELILSAFYRAMLGMQQTKLGLQEGAWAIEARLSGNQLNPMELLKAACPEKRTLFETESLQVHNELRKLHGVPPLTHSEFLCEMAREWAEHLAIKDTTYHRSNKEYGENLYYSHGVPLDARKAITTWYDEINLYNYNDPQLSKDTGHFTQLVWRDTKQLGTGIAQLGDKVWVCCYYHPAGNIESLFGEQFVPRPVKDT